MTRPDPDHANAGTMPAFASSRDSHPIALLGQHTPGGAAWARTIVITDSIGAAVAHLENVHLTRPIETLEAADDWIAAAVRHWSQGYMPEAQPFLFVVVALVSDPESPLVFELTDSGTMLVEVGRVGFDGDVHRVLGPRGAHDVRTIVIPQEVGR